jgi:hypothetical protein
MSFQMILVISSPSSSTTGFLTLIFLIPVADAIVLTGVKLAGRLKEGRRCVLGKGSGRRRDDGMVVDSDARKQRKGIALITKKFREREEETEMI